MDYDDSGVLRYNSGRNNRDTVFPNGTSTIMIFENVKAFLVNKGVAHWGNTVSVRNAEFHDVRVGAMLFGSASVLNSVIVGRTKNLNPKSSFLVYQYQMGFQFYGKNQNIKISLEFHKRHPNDFFLIFMSFNTNFLFIFIIFHFFSFRYMDDYNFK